MLTNDIKTTTHSSIASRRRYSTSKKGDEQESSEQQQQPQDELPPDYLQHPLHLLHTPRGELAAHLVEVGVHDLEAAVVDLRPGRGHGPGFIQTRAAALLQLARISKVAITHGQRHGAVEPRAGMVGLRWALTRPEQQTWHADGTMDWLWPAAGPVATPFDEVKSKGLSISGKAGDPVTFPASEISDWMRFRPNGVIEGGYTTRVMISQMSEEERASYDVEFAALPATRPGLKISAGN